MTSEQFDKLVNRIQAQYSSRPLALRMRIAVLVALGYSGFLALLLIVLVSAAGLIVGAVIAGKEPSIFLMAIVAVLLAFGICQTLVFLWVPLESQQAREVTRDETPRLFDLLDALKRDLKAIEFHHVRITSDFNASVLMIPRLGVFGFNRSHLYLGLPFMRVLTPEQFAAVMAHEFAHCSSGHDRFGMWIYRLRATWSRVFAELQDNKSVGVVKSFRSVILKFVDWYWPRFNAYSFVLSRQNEYEADRISADRVGHQHAAEALFRTDCLGHRLNDKFWNDLMQQARQQNVVAEDFVERVERFFDSEPEPSDAARWLEKSAQTLTGNIDTHPCLTDRLKALGYSVDEFASAGFPRLPLNNAADVFLGAALPEITRNINRDWQKDNELRWHNVYHQARRLEKQYESVLKANPVTTSTSVTGNDVSPVFDVNQLWEQAKAICELNGTGAAEPLLRQLLMQSPSHALANVTLGGHLLEQSQSEGEELIRRILDDESSEFTSVACQRLIAYYQQRGQQDKLQQTIAHLGKYEATQRDADVERSSVRPTDTFVDHDLSKAELSELKEILAKDKSLNSAWLVRKKLNHFPRQRLFVLVVRSQPTGFFGGTNADADRQLVTRLIQQVKLPGRVLVVSPQGGFKALARKIMPASDARIFGHES